MISHSSLRGGSPELRSVIAEQYEGFGIDQICVTNGSSESNFAVIASLVDQPDHMVVEHPNYPSLYEVPRSLGLLGTRSFGSGLLTSNSTPSSLGHKNPPRLLILDALVSDSKKGIVWCEMPVTCNSHSLIRGRLKRVVSSGGLTFLKNSGSATDETR